MRHLLSLYDVVLTTYSIVEYEYREEAGHSKVKCKYCGRKFRPDRLPVHQRYFCGPLAQRTQNQKKTEKKKAGKRFGKAQLSLPDDEDYDDADNDNGEDDIAGDIDVSKDNFEDITEARDRAEQQLEEPSLEGSQTVSN